MKHSVKEPPLTVSKKEIYICRCILFTAFCVLLLLRTFTREAASLYFDRLTWFTNFNFITESSFTAGLNSKFFKPFAAVFYAVFLLLISVVLEKFYHSFSDEKKFGKTMLLAITAACPGLFIYYCSPTVYDRAGYIVLMLIMLRLLYFKKSFLIWLTPVFSVLCILIQHKSFLTFYPAVFIISLMICKEYKFKKLFLITDAAVSLITFVSVSDFDNIKKQIADLQETAVDLIAVVPIVVFILFVFLKSFAVKKEIKYLIYFVLPAVMSGVAFFIVPDNSTVFAELLISHMLVILFFVINNEKNLTAQVNSVIDFCNDKPILSSVMLFFEAFFLRIDPSYFGNTAYRIFNYFSF